MTVEIVVAHYDDWCGIYISGEMAYQDHGERWDMVLPDLVGETIGSYREMSVEALPNLDMFGNRFPIMLKDLKLELDKANQLVVGYPQVT